MVLSFSVKNTLILVPFFLLIYLVIFVILASFGVFSSWIVNYSTDFSLTKHIVINNIPIILYRVVPFSVFFSLLLVAFRVLIKPGKRFLTVLLLLILSYSVFLLSVLFTAGFSSRVTPEHVSFRKRLFEEKLNPIGRYSLYPVTVSKVKAESKVDSFIIYTGLDNSISGDKVSKTKKRRGTLTFFNNVSVKEKEGNTFLVPADGSVRDLSKAIEIEENASSSFGSLLKTRGFIGRFLSDLGVMNYDVSVAFKKDKKLFFILSLSIIFLFVSCGVFMRITRWPLFNILLSFLVLRGVFYFYRFLRFVVANEIAGIIGVPDLKTYLPTYVMFGVGILIFLFDFLFVPFDRWKREIEE